MQDLFEGPVVVQEKVDGSQFSFGNIGGKLCARSKGAPVGEAVKKKIFKEFYPDIERGIMRGFPEFYKARLLEAALNDGN